MKRKLEFILLATGILSLVYINLFALRASRLADTGREVLLELAPLDPLSLVQGQYMQLRFAIEDTYPLEEPVFGEIDRVVLMLDEQNVGRVDRPYQGGPLGEREVLFQASVDVNDGTYRVRLQQRSFLFEENQQDRYQGARLGIFRVKENGDYVLVDLADKDFRPLSP
ncbi:MAG: GDYXXLXY domain-containing protein [Pirellulaceae bacterium]